MRKLFLDVETTGLDKDKNGIIQLACLVENTKGKIIGTFVANIKPFKGCVYAEDAENVHGKSEDTISTYEDESDVLFRFIEWLKKYKVGTEQFSITGYNSRFDQDFIAAWFKRNRQVYWNYFNYYDIDVFALVKILGLSGMYENKSSKKLVALCNLFDIKLDAHDALNDIKATRKLYKKIMKRYIK